MKKRDRLEGWDSITKKFCRGEGVIRLSVIEGRWVGLFAIYEIKKGE